MREMLQNNRRAAIAGAVGIGLVIIVLVVRLLTSGGGPPAALSPPVVPGAPSSTVAPGAPGAVAPGSSSTTAPAGQVAPSAQVYNSKDPFAPLVSPTTTPPATTGTTTPSTTGTTTPSTTGTTTATSTPGTTTVSPTTSTTVSPSGRAGASGAGTGTGTSTSPTSGQPVELEDVYATGSQTYASIEVDDSLYQVTTGQTFAGNYSVLDLSLASQCGDFSHGGVPFHVCKGQEVLK